MNAQSHPNSCIDSDEDVDMVDPLVDGFWAGVKATSNMIGAVVDKTSSTLEKSGASEMFRKTGDSVSQTTSQLMAQGLSAPVVSRTAESVTQMGTGLVTASG